MIANAGVGLLAGIGQRLLNFCGRYGDLFRQCTRTVETSVRHHMRELLQAKTKGLPRRAGVRT